MEGGAESPHCARAGFGAFEDGGVACCDGEEDRADAEDVGGVPGVLLEGAEIRYRGYERRYTMEQWPEQHQRAP